MNAAVEQILARLRDQKVEVPAAEVESRLALLVEKFGVPEAEAIRSVVNYFLKEHGVSPATFAPKKAESLKVGEINGPGRWIDLEAKDDGQTMGRTRSWRQVAPETPGGCRRDALRAPRAHARRGAGVGEGHRQGAREFGASLPRRGRRSTVLHRG
ncbi:MAG TPA: hypothetical protein PKJ51_10455, partial [Methanothrix sp.]|nr:hypothetical protein [Methanothrix sp.]